MPDIYHKPPINAITNKTIIIIVIVFAGDVFARDACCPAADGPWAICSAGVAVGDCGEIGVVKVDAEVEAGLGVGNGVKAALIV